MNTTKFVFNLERIYILNSYLFNLTWILSPQLSAAVGVIWLLYLLVNALA